MKIGFNLPMLGVVSNIIILQLACMRTAPKISFQDGCSCRCYPSSPMGGKLVVVAGPSRSLKTTLTSSFKSSSSVFKCLIVLLVLVHATMTMFSLFGGGGVRGGWRGWGSFPHRRRRLRGGGSMMMAEAERRIQERSSMTMNFMEWLLCPLPYQYHTEGVWNYSYTCDVGGSIMVSTPR